MQLDTMGRRFIAWLTLGGIALQPGLAAQEGAGQGEDNDFGIQPRDRRHMTRRPYGRP